MLVRPAASLQSQLHAKAHLSSRSKNCPFPVAFLMSKRLMDGGVIASGVSGWSR
ncbi:hypothetical protein GCWU000342_01971 [Shuttleworthella satelles DSM 14600]|uniref:Uncharacterized protein n=1 Tax=Shuttleworthella satelles DSM 14600 TaxID=626523 RepID=C4GE25_9FIRM|nr:hypothetical protein GCWU000342_01971 [Shuttleworthia satelles DSM 14600]